jgi:4'-phosphopantetheinyl transferase EntD
VAEADLIEGVLPSSVAWSETLDDPPDAVLVPEEAASLSRASDKRRLEYTTGRHCARRALAQLGVVPAAILTGSAGEPHWPEGVVGSITHCAGYRAAAVAWAADVSTIGIDAEPHDPLPTGVLEAVSRSEERSLIRRLAGSAPDVYWDRLLFSAKEAVYKAWYPLARRMLGFEEAVVTIQQNGTLSARLRVPGPMVSGRPLRALSGRWTVTAGLVLTAVTELNDEGSWPGPL